MSLLSLIPDKAWILLGGFVMAVLTVLGIRRGGAKDERTRRKANDLEAYKETRRRMDATIDDGNAAAARERLRHRSDKR